MALQEVGVKLIAQDAQQFDSTMQRSGEAIADFGRTAERAGEGVNALDRIIGGAFERIGHVITDTMVNAGQALGDFFASSIAEANEAADGQAQLAAVLESTAGAAGVSADMANNLASQYQDLTKFTDDQILAAENLLLTFTQIGSDVFPDVTAITLDMATALKSTPEAMALLTGKALSSAEGLTALTRSGVQFSEAQKELIKNLFDTGRAAEAQKIILAELNKEFGGSAAAAAQTFGGKLTQLGNKFGEMKETIGQALIPAIEPLVDILAEILPNAIGPIVGLIQQVAQGFATFINTIKNAPSVIDGIAQAIDNLIPGLGNIAKAVFTYGANIVNQLAAGMRSAFAAIVSVLQQIGSVIASWLRPGSPPKITPDLDKWGAQAATVYIEGWKNADFSALKDLGGEIQNVLKGLADVGAIGKVDIIPILFGSQQAISDAINEIRTVGDVSEETFQRIIDAAGPAGPQVEGLIRAYFDLEEATQAVQQAQQELNDVTAAYASTLSPLQGELKKLQNREQEIKDMQRVEKLQQILADDKATAADKELAQLEIQQIQLQSQIRSVEDERDVAVDAAQQKLDAAKAEQTAAQERYAAQQASLDLYNQQNQLIAEQTKLLEDLAAAAAASAAGGGGGGGLGGGLALPEIDPSQFTAPIDEITTSIDAGKQRFFEFKESIIDMRDNGLATIAPFFEPVKAAITELQTVFASINPVIQTNMSAFQTNVETVLTVVTGFIEEHGDEIVAFFSESWGHIKDIMAAAAGIYQATIAPIVTGVASFLSQHADTIQAILGNAWTAVSTTITTILGTLSGIFQATLQVIQGDWEGAWQTILDTATGLSEGINTIVQSNLDGLKNIFALIGSAILAIFGENVESIKKKATDGFEGLRTIVTNILTNLQTTMTTVWEDILSGIESIVDTILTTVTDKFEETKSAATDKMNEVKDTISGLAGDFLDAALSIGSSVVDGLIEGISNGIGAVTNAARELAQSAVDAALDVIKPGSPSIVFTELGETIPQGLMKGIENQIPALLDVVSKMGHLVVEEAMKSVSGIQQALEELMLAQQRAALESAVTMPRQEIRNQQSLESLRVAPSQDLQKAQDAVISIEEKLRKLDEDNYKKTEDIYKKRDEAQVAAREKHAQTLIEIDEKINQKRLSLDEAYTKQEKQINDRANEAIVSENERLTKRLEDAGKALLKVEQDRQDKMAEIGESAQDQRLSAEEAYQKRIAAATSDEERAKLQKNLQNILASIDQSTQAEREKANKEYDKRRLKAERDVTAKREEIMTDHAQQMYDIEKGRGDDLTAARIDFSQRYLALEDERNKQIAQATNDLSNQMTQISQATYEEQRKAAEAYIEKSKILEQELAAAKAKAAFEQTKYGEIQNKYNDIYFRAQQELADAEKQAAEIRKTDAKQGDKFFQLRSNQIFELAKLEQQLADAQAAGGYFAAQPILERIRLTKEAQAAELALFQAEAGDDQNRIKNLQKQLEEAKSLGNELINGIVDGINKNLGDLTQAISAAIQQAVEAAQKALGIHSPSKVAAEIIGKPFVTGIVEGMMENIHQLTSASRTAMEAMGTVRPPASAQYQAQQAQANIITNTMNYNLNVTTNQSSQGVIQDFAMMRALALR